MPLFFLFFAVLLAVPVVWPGVDIFLSGAFYRAGEGFFLANNIGFTSLHFLANAGARVLAVGLGLLALLSWAKRKRYMIDAKAWLFLLIALLVGPGLVANVVFKDHWGRARPREISEFGGVHVFSSALTPQFDKAKSNGSFVSGDGAFGFFLPAVAFVVPGRLRRRAFWAGLGAGGAFGFARLAMGAHFFSDVVYAAFLMLLVTVGVHALMFGRAETVARWIGFFSPSAPMPLFLRLSRRPFLRSLFQGRSVAETQARQP